MTTDAQLDWQPATAAEHLLAPPVRDFLAGWPSAGQLAVAPIDAELADTAAFCQAYGVPMEKSANCVVVTGKRGGEVRYAACLVLAVHRADVNGAVRRLLDVRKASFAAMAEAVELTGMEYGGITPVGLPSGWPVLVSAEVAAAGEVVIGSGLRRSKLLVDGALLAELPGGQVVPDLSQPAK
ncbi:MAG: YbaK/EbsC family protein [Actinobacteria bacterium]|nr:YbaK/EbsC family protein [Actinomycetota bacterium]